MSGFDLGPIRLASCWRPLLHARIRELTFPPLPDIDCDNCRMVRLGMFADPIRCCDYVPPLPSFLAGEILSEGQADGSRERVERWVAAGRGDPLFVNTPPRLIASHRKQRQPCPLLDDQTHCTIYEHRPYLCVGYNCIFPRDPTIPGLWNGIASLLALHSALAAQVIMIQLGLDGEQYTSAWEQAGPTPWTEQDGLEPALREALWQGWEPRSYYRRAFEHIMDHADTIRGDIERYRREQLIRRNQRTRAELDALPLDPEPREPPAAIRRVLERRVLTFAEHTWTVVEHESFVLWFWGQTPNPR